MVCSSPLAHGHLRYREEMWWNRSNMRRQISFGSAVGLLLWVALYNGYPLVWWDSGTYVRSSFLLEVPPSRPVFYGLFLLLAHWRLTLWGVVLAQSAVVVYLLRAVIENVGPAQNAGTRRDLELVGITACLAIGTSLPWFTGWVMSDVFAGVCVLSLFRILCEPLPRREGLAIGVLLVLSMIVHLSHLPLAIVLLILARCGQRVRRSLFPSTGAWRRAWLCVGIALVCVPSTNRLLTGRAFFSNATHVFLLARLLSDGIPQKLLAEHCSERHYQLCQYQADLPLSLGYYLWDPNSPLERTGGWGGSQAESWRVIEDCLREYPVLVLQGAVRTFFIQLGSFRTAADLRPFLEGTAINYEMQRRFPNEYGAYRASRQQQGRLSVDIFTWLHWWVFVFSAVVSIGIVLWDLWNGMMDMATLQHIFVWAAMVSNAAIVSISNEPDDRFQARLAWLIPFSVLVSACRTRPLTREACKMTVSLCNA
jgi:hypothetical protein